MRRVLQIGEFRSHVEVNLSGVAVIVLSSSYINTLENMRRSFSKLLINALSLTRLKSGPAMATKMLIIVTNTAISTSVYGIGQSTDACVV